MMIDGTRAHGRATTLVSDDYTAFNRGDWQAMLALLTDDVAHDLNQRPVKPRGMSSPHSWRGCSGVIVNSYAISW